MEKLFAGIIIGTIALAIIGILSLIVGFPLMWLWNWLMPELFGMKMITFWQAVGLNFLCGILFKSQSVTSSKD